ncbi:MAG: 6-bladed beta-propeller [Dysgonamonadaceae bacterium]|jgi:hypothetical protein|nr:6-bladed beta-propeller [Dysgonamonadaceae bacterium]
MKTTFLFAFLLLFGCGQVSKEPALLEHEGDNSFEKKITIDAIDENTVMKYSEIYSDVRFVRLETQDNCLIGRINKIIAVDDKFIILDEHSAKKIFVFDSSGKFLNTVGSNGAGPEEYDEPDDMAYDEHNDELLVWCHNRKTIMKFKLDGTFVKNIKVNYWAASIHAVDKNSCLLYLNNYTQKDGKINDHNILIIDDSGNVVSGLLPYNKDGIKLSPPSGDDFFTFQKELLFSPYYRNRTFKINTDSAKISTKYFFDFGKNNIPSSLIYSVDTDREFDKKIRNMDYAFNISFAETASHVVNSFVYKGRIFSCFHSKESGETKYSSIFINDVHALAASGNHFSCIKDSLLISCADPQAFVKLQDFAQELKNDAKGTMKKQLKGFNPFTSIFGGKVIDNLLQAIESSDMKASKEEIDFINSIEESDNPIIQISTLKKF